jgi:DNA polymerase I-like protein with 3'-5' exonuclease and polymerase domains
MPFLIHNQKFHLEDLLFGKNRYTVSDSGTWKTNTINTLEEFNAFYEKLVLNKVTCVDLETANLTRKANTILTIHFSLDGESAFNLPLFHRESPFGSEEQEYIKKKLTEYFQDGKSEYLVFHNAKFDVSVLMGQLNLKFFNHKVFDTMGGTFCFHPDTLVETELGPLSISKLCSKDYQDTLIKSYNHSTNQVELKPILSSITLRNLKQVVEISYEGGEIAVTEDHEIWSVTKNNYVQASKIEISEEIIVSCLSSKGLQRGKVLNVKQGGQLDYVCDITVKDNHNLFVGHPGSRKFILVHNCLSENLKFLTEALSVPMYSLKTLAYQYGCSAYEEGNLTKESRRNMADQKLADIMEYASKDVIIPYQIHNFQIQEAERRGYKNWKKFVCEQLGAMILVFARMEVMGLLVDKRYLMYQMSKEGQVGKLLAETAENFKNSENCKEVNKYLLIQKAISEDFKAQISKTKSLSRKLKSTVTKLEKPVSAKKTKVMPLLEQLEDSSKTKEDCINALNSTQKILLEGEETGNKALVEILEEIKEFVDKKVDRLGEYPKLVQKCRLEYSLAKVKESAAKFNPSFVSEEVIAGFQELTEHLNKVLDGSYYKENIGNEWLFDIAKRATQQLLFFTVLKLDPVEERKDGGGKTNVAFQETYKELHQEVAWYDNYTKYKKLMSTYIEGIYERLTQEKEQEEYNLKLKEVAGTAEETLLVKPEPTDSLVDGRLRASYGFTQVVTGRSGCLSGETKVLTDKGEIEIARIVREKLGYGTLTHQGNWKPIVDWFESGEREVFEVELESGKKITLTACHPFWTKEGWVKLEDLKIGDEVQTLF